jgi:5-(carboxyamino)imidazole ribonucleotide synthase
VAHRVVRTRPPGRLGLFAVSSIASAPDPSSASDPSTPFPSPGSGRDVVGTPVVGVIGAGQLARMMQPPAIALGVRLRVLAARADEPAAQVVPETVIGEHDDPDTVAAFARGCDVVTFDHEHVPAPVLERLLAQGTALRPGPAALLYAQDKAAMRERLSAIGVPCPAWRRVSSAGELADFAQETTGTADLGAGPVILKAVRGGYDGKGVWRIETLDEAERVIAEAAARGVELIAEEFVPFVRELSAQVARSPHGQAVAYPVVETVQRDGICREVYAPAPGLPDSVAAEAQRIALEIAKQLDVTGMLAVELFETRTPAPHGGLLVNELAMRPHNSGHWTIDGAVTSQFENHLRAVLDWPLGSPTAHAPVTVMANVLGLDLPEVHPAYLHCMARDPGLKIHLYGKAVKPGRKIGHVTAAGRDLADCVERARHAAAFLRGEIDE